MKIKKAIIAAAGYGTRFLPATKVISKEMLPLIDRPIIQVLVEEAVNSGIEEIILVTRPGVATIKRHFSPHTHLEAHLRQQGKKEWIKELKKINRLAKFCFIEQDASFPYGTGSPLLSARNHIKKGESFILMFGDDLVKSKIPVSKQLINLWQKNPGSIILAAQEVKPAEVSRYGIFKLKKGTTNQMEKLIEKPKEEKRPSCLASLGRYLLNWEILQILKEQVNGSHNGKEFYLTDAITAYAQKKPALVMPIDGKWLTTGDPLNWLKANVEFALMRPDYGPQFKAYLKSLKL